MAIPPRQGNGAGVASETTRHGSSSASRPRESASRSICVPEKFAQAVREAVHAGELHDNAPFFADPPNARHNSSSTELQAAVVGKRTPDSTVNADSIAMLHELSSAALAARAVRNSLRQLVGALTSTSAATQTRSVTQDGSIDMHSITHGASIDALRAKVHQDMARLRVHGAPSDARAPGAPPRMRSPQTVEAAPRDLAPRFRLRAGAGKFVLAASCSAESKHVAIVISTGTVEIWEQDPFSWHLAARADVPLPSHGACAAATLSPCGLRLWLALGDTGGTAGSGQARLSPSPSCQVVLLARVSLGPLCAVAATPFMLGSFLARPVSLQEIGGHVAAAVAFHQEESMLSTNAAADVQKQADTVRVFRWKQRAASSTMFADGGASLEGEFAGEGGPAVPDFDDAISFEVFPQRLASSAPQAATLGSIEGAWVLPAVLTGPPMKASAGLACGDTGGGGVFDVADCWRLAVCVREMTTQLAEVQVRSGRGECLAVLPLGDGVSCLAVPLQGNCPADMLGRLHISSDPPPFVVLTECCKSEGSHAVECVVSIAAVDAFAGAPRPLQVGAVSREMQLLQTRPLYSFGLPAPCADVLSISESLVGCRSSTAASYIVDWQQLRAHRLPRGWVPLGVSPSTVVVLLPQPTEISSAILGGVAERKKPRPADDNEAAEASKRQRLLQMARPLHCSSAAGRGAASADTDMSEAGGSELIFLEPY
mmetsp:Transcript_126787/g.253493  ORF Transcript_126787/g.253493 Transcript_126787/m.253493 type:complete len:713 (+) Transcript_126787:82-2220(+)|eukprot:CAMPEP_0172675154 /NCGR_PEP_ID=MMETSP1074-20121228/13114_1 /TAXON_ID=2916 /ORGANISM="Ceratium fusus, Strain PA161109" /LENGTH=712 /DNA_ID=CAMNT_0013492601 /DNA_START=81 /DNA_END=2219 /DNA_ORIENTATION=-